MGNIYEGVVAKDKYGDSVILNILNTPSSLQALATGMPAKAEVVAIVPLVPGTATTAQIATAFNALLTALQATS